MPHEALDDLDRAVVARLTDDPRLPVVELARLLGVARGTAQARMERLQRRGALLLEARIEPAAIGYAVTAFLTIELHQDVGRESVTAQLSAIPNVLEAHTITGSGDLMARVVARSNADLQTVIDRVVSAPAVARTSTVIALEDIVQHRTGALLAQH